MLVWLMSAGHFFLGMLRTTTAGCADAFLTFTLRGLETCYAAVIGCGWWV